MNFRISNPRMSGYSIFELVVVMTIVAILAAIAIPSFRYVTSSNRVAAEINSLLADLRYARSEAIKEGLPVSLCASADGLTCSKSAASWQSGWIVFSDPGSSLTVPAAGPLRVQPAFNVSFNNSTDVVVADNGFYAETFNRQGFGAAVPTPTTAYPVTLALHTAPVNASATRCLQITAIGLLTIEKNGVGNCT